MDRRQVLSCLAAWITEILLGIPPKLRPTLLELLLGCIGARSGHVTDAMLSIIPGKSWTTYYKAIEKGVFSWLQITKRWLFLLCNVLEIKEITLAVDDTLIFRSSKKAPSVGEHYDHANRTNRPKYVLAQLFVSVAMICNYHGRMGAFPLFMQMNSTQGNRSKIKIAILLIRILKRWIGHNIPVRILMDAWYMKGPVIFEILNMGFHAIGQVRRDTALYLVPEIPQKRKRGRPRKYGLKITLQDIKKLFPLQTADIIAYGKERKFQYYSLTPLVRFLKGKQCRVVWSRFQKSAGEWTKWHLLISTDTSLSGLQVIQRYAGRWWIESCFNELKNLFGFKNTWQQSNRVAARWRCIVCLAYGLPRLLALLFGPKLGKNLLPIPWRKKHPMTAGWAANAVARIFRSSRVRDFWDRKHQKCCIPEDVLDMNLDKTG